MLATTGTPTRKCVVTAADTSATDHPVRSITDDALGGASARHLTRPVTMDAENIQIRIRIFAVADAKSCQSRHHGMHDSLLQSERIGRNLRDVIRELHGYGRSLVACAFVTMKRGIAAPCVHSALPMTRRSAPQLLRVR